ncbi:DUF4837 family protein [Brumimicrobium salinarum]|nr:DUF4837 family protein [Brumimicrobium salinarum]
MKYYYLLLFTAFILFSCGDSTETLTRKDNKKQQSLQNNNNEIPTDDRQIIKKGSISQYTGKPGKLIIVAENTIYTKELKVLFDSVFSAPIKPYYPYTPYFEIVHRTPTKFKQLSTRLRNVIEIDLNEKYKKNQPKMEILEDYYAKTQLYTKLKAHDINDVYELIQEEINYLFKIYERQEWKREYYRHAKNENNHVNQKLAKQFGINLKLPDNLRYESISDEYAILLFPNRTRNMEMKTTNSSYTDTKVNFIQSGLMIWEYPFKDERQLKPENLMIMRDTILKYYAKHEIEGVYMGTQNHPAVKPIYHKIKIGDIEGWEFKGLFKFTGEAEPSGGRFWSFHFKHPHRNTIVALSGYIDAPPTFPANFDINRIRAIIYSLSFTD